MVKVHPFSWIRVNRLDSIPFRGNIQYLAFAVPRERMETDKTALGHAVIYLLQRGKVGVLVSVTRLT